MAAKGKAKIITLAQALVKARHYCSYQERCHQELRNKLYDWGLKGSEVENILAELISTGFLNEERFARLFAGGKFRIKNWGRLKIVVELRKRKISQYCINKGLEEIEEEDYRNTIIGLIEKKERTIRVNNPVLRKRKIFLYLLGKGYEADIVGEIIDGHL